MSRSSSLGAAVVDDAFNRYRDGFTRWCFSGRDLSICSRSGSGSGSIDSRRLNVSLYLSSRCFWSRSFRRRGLNRRSWRFWSRRFWSRRFRSWSRSWFLNNRSRCRSRLLNRSRCRSRFLNRSRCRSGIHFVTGRSVNVYTVASSIIASSIIAIVSSAIGSSAIGSITNNYVSSRWSVWCGSRSRSFFDRATIGINRHRGGSIVSSNISVTDSSIATVSSAISVGWHGRITNGCVASVFGDWAFICINTNFGYSAGYTFFSFTISGNGFTVCGIDIGILNLAGHVTDNDITRNYFDWATVRTNNRVTVNRVTVNRIAAISSVAITLIATYSGIGTTFGGFGEAFAHNTRKWGV